ncbi:MAG TPA: thioredoxin family protein, partial [Petrotogaceae bacterium]|nr:thioredoxin family protein [Petrotogaceae bacterium]
IDKKVRIRVFVTPTCPYCPKAVISAHQTAMANSEMVVAEMFEANEFGNESQKYNVSSVPHTIIEVKENDGWVKTGEFIGAYPEDNYISELMQAIDTK